MMEELSLHILDIAENGINAGANCVEIEVDISEERREKAKESVYEIVRRIKDREFTATPSSFKCKYCDFRSICKDAIL